MKAAVAVLAVAVVALAGWVRSQSASIREQEQAITQLRAATTQKATTVGLELQARCAEQARKVFAERNSKSIGGYENHYNAQLDKCFVEIGETIFLPGDLTISKLVLDAFEGRIVGSFIFITPKGGPASVIDCSVTLPFGGKKTCRTQDEFTELVKVYMEGGR